MDVTAASGRGLGLVRLTAINCGLIDKAPAAVTAGDHLLSITAEDVIASGFGTVAATSVNSGSGRAVSTTSAPPALGDELARDRLPISEAVWWCGLLQ